MLLNLLRSGGGGSKETKASAAGKLVAFHASTRGAWSPRDAETLTRQGYQRNAVVYRCVRMVAEAAASTGVVVSSMSCP